MQDYLYGATSGFTQTIIGHPMDTYKVRFQNGILSKNGVGWSGIKYPLFSSMFINAGVFGTYNQFKNIGMNNFQSGFMSGLIISPFVFLSDVGKVKKQTGKSFDWDNIRYQKGIFSTTIKESFSFGIYFYTFNILKDLDIHPFISGGLSGIISWASTYPFDVIRNRQIFSNMTMSNAFKKGNLMIGFWICMTRAFVVNSSGLWVYDVLKIKYG